MSGQNRSVRVGLVPLDDESALLLVRAQMRELMETWQHREVSDDDVTAELGTRPMAGLALMALARSEEAPVGCGALRVVGTIGELTKVYVVPTARGTGVGEAVVGALEQAARARGLVLIRLDTRADLPAPAALYRRLGYQEVPPWHDRPYADHFFTKDL